MPCRAVPHFFFLWGGSVTTRVVHSERGQCIGQTTRETAAAQDALMTGESQPGMAACSVWRHGAEKNLSGARLSARAQDPIIDAATPRSGSGSGQPWAPARRHQSLQCGGTQQHVWFSGRSLDLSSLLISAAWLHRSLGFAVDEASLRDTIIIARFKGSKVM